MRKTVDYLRETAGALLAVPIIVEVEIVDGSDCAARWTDARTLTLNASVLPESLLDGTLSAEVDALLLQQVGRRYVDDHPEVDLIKAVGLMGALLKRRAIEQAMNDCLIRRPRRVA